jgi:hypothetical protein
MQIIKGIAIAAVLINSRTAGADCGSISGV